MKKINLKLISEEISIPKIEVTISDEKIREALVFLKDNDHYIDEKGNIILIEKASS